MTKLSCFVSFARKHANAADFVIIYLEEAHPTDGWMYPAVQHFIAQHTAIEQRLAAASLLATELNQFGNGSGSVFDGDATTVKLYVDSMLNTASVQFGALPERLAIIMDGKVCWIGGKGPMEYSIPKAEEALQRLMDA